MLGNLIAIAAIAAAVSIVPTLSGANGWDTGDLGTEAQPPVQTTARPLARSADTKPKLVTRSSSTMVGVFR